MYKFVQARLSDDTGHVFCVCKLKHVKPVTYLHTLTLPKYEITGNIEYCEQKMNVYTSMYFSADRELFLYLAMV